LLNSLVLIVSNLSMWLFLRRKLRKVKITDLHPLQHLRGSLRLFIPTLAISLYTVLDKTLIGFITHNDAENGFYEQAEKIVKISMTLVTCLGTVMIPRNSYELEHGNVDKVRSNNYNALHFVFLIGIPLLVGNIIIARNLIPWFLGTDFNQSILLMQVLAPLVLIIGISNVIGLQYLLPYRKDRQFTLAITLGALINLCLNIPLIYFWGSIGAAISTIVAELTVTTTMLIMSFKHLSLFKILKMAIKPAIASLVMGLLIYPLSLYLSSSILNTIIIAFTGAVIYGIVILILRDDLVTNFFKQSKKQLLPNKEDSSSEN